VMIRGTCDIAHSEGSRLLDLMEYLTRFSEHKAELVKIIGQNPVPRRGCGFPAAADIARDESGLTLALTLALSRFEAEREVIGPLP